MYHWCGEMECCPSCRRMLVAEFWENSALRFGPTSRRLLAQASLAICIVNYLQHI